MEECKIYMPNSDKFISNIDTNLDLEDMFALLYYREQLTFVDTGRTIHCYPTADNKICVKLVPAEDEKWRFDYSKTEAETNKEKLPAFVEYYFDKEGFDLSQLCEPLNDMMIINNTVKVELPNELQDVKLKIINVLEQNSSNNGRNTEDLYFTARLIGQSISNTFKSFTSETKPFMGLEVSEAEAIGNLNSALANYTKPQSVAERLHITNINEIYNSITEQLCDSLKDISKCLDKYPDVKKIGLLTSENLEFEIQEILDIAEEEDRRNQRDEKSSLISAMYESVSKPLDEIKDIADTVIKFIDVYEEENPIRNSLEQANTIYQDYMYHSDAYTINEVKNCYFDAFTKTIDQWENQRKEDIVKSVNEEKSEQPTKKEIKKRSNEEMLR